MEGKRFTDISNDSTYDNLSLVGSSNRRTKFRIVPGINFALAVDERSVRVHFCDLFRDWSVWSSISAAGHDYRQVEEFRDSCMGNDVVSELIRRVVANQLEKSKLVIHHKEHRIIFVDPAESLIFHYKDVRILKAQDG